MAAPHRFAAGSASASSLSITHRRVTFRRGSDVTLVGTLDSCVAASASSKRCAILCHGMQCNREDLFYPDLSDAILTHCASVVSHVLRFDLSGHGESGGKWNYGGYATIVDDIAAAQKALEEEEGFEVTHMIGHSFSASGVLLHAGTHPGAIPRVIALSARFDMSHDVRLSKEDLMVLIRDGIVHWKKGVSPKAATVPITLGDMQDRLRTDMTVVKHATARTLIMHGLTDKIIPPADAERLHELLTGTGPECAASTLSLQGDDTSAVFSPPIGAHQHVLVLMPDTDHSFFSVNWEFVRMLRAVTQWIDETAPEAKAEKQPEPAAQEVAAQPEPAAQPEVDADVDAFAGFLAVLTFKQR